MCTKGGFYSQDTWNTSAAKDLQNVRSSFITLCHGEPWVGNVQYRYQSHVLVDNNQNEEAKTPTEAVFGGT